MLSRSNLHDYQNRAVEFVLSKKRSYLALDLGLGKTATSLTAISDLLDACIVERVLIIAPLRVANSVWKQESQRWQHTKHLNVLICTGSERQRIAALQTKADVYVINRENVEWLTKHLKKWSFDCVVIDEASGFKNASSRRFKALKRVAADINYIWLLSGTPTSNGLLDLWPQMYLVDFGERLGRTITGFKSRFFEKDFMGYNLTARKNSSDKIHALVADKMMSMSAEDYLEVPDRLDIVQRVMLPASALKAYNELEKTLLTEINDEQIEAINAAALANKLLQASNGCIYTDSAGNSVEIHSAKLDALAELIEDNAGENLLVAYNYKTDLKRLQKRFPSAVVLGKEQKTIDNWNAGKIQMLLAHPASAGHGLNLQRGGSVVVWFGLNWSLELYQQFNGRLHRQGQPKPVRVIHLVAKGCIDERVMTAISEKRKIQDALIDAIKEIKLN
ncbi:MAG: DEAD/DEAH box helicase [Methyloprofundus sp.]|nr:DEAD/DEAH box helicase [Methyloprofundus sp.]